MTSKSTNWENRQCRAHFKGENTAAGGIDGHAGYVALCTVLDGELSTFTELAAGGAPAYARIALSSVFTAAPTDGVIVNQAPLSWTCNDVAGWSIVGLATFDTATIASAGTFGMMFYVPLSTIAVANTQQILIPTGGWQHTEL